MHGIECMLVFILSDKNKMALLTSDPCIFAVPTVPALYIGPIYYIHMQTLCQNVGLDGEV